MGEIEKLQRDLKKTLNYEMAKLSDILKKTEMEKEKRGKVNKKPATMLLMVDKTVMIRFDEPNEGQRLFDGFKETK